MDIVYEEILEKEIAEIRKKKKKQIIILGCEYCYVQLYQRLKKEGINVSAFLNARDDFEMGVTYKGTRVIDKEELLLIHNPLVILFEKDKDIFNTLISKNQSIENIVLPVEKSLNVLNRKEKIKYFTSLISVYQDAYKIYKSLLKEHKVEKILVFSGQSGDLFNALTYLNEFIRATGDKGNFVLTVIGTPCHKVAKMFDVERVEKLTVLQTKKLIMLYELCGKEINIVPVHSSQAHIKNTVYTKMIRRKGITLGKMYKYQAFKLSTATRPQLPNYIRNSDFVKKMFDDKKLPPNRTVLVSPYANSYMDDAILIEWEGFCSWLMENGYKVLTNCGNETEKPIKGTEGIFVPLEYIVDFIEQGGHFVGIRSGLCDIVSGANCKKIILYKEDLYKRGDYTEFHSLNGMRLCNDAIEIKYTSETQKEVFKKLNNYFTD